MATAIMEAEDSSMISENPRIVGLESQILNSQEIIVRLNGELDNALLRITTLENLCSENQTDLHEKRLRIKELNDDLSDREETNERLTQELNDKNEKLQNLEDLILQLKEHIKQKAEEEENRSSQIQFDRQLRELLVDELNEEHNSPQELLDQYHTHERLKFHDLLQQSLTTEDISHLIDSDDILFELLTHLNSLSRLKETLSRDSKQLQHIRSLLQLTNEENNDELINDLINKRQCIEFLRSKTANQEDLTDFDLIKHVLHEYFNFQQQQFELKEYLQLDSDQDVNYSRVLIERCNEVIHGEIELNARMKSQDQTIEQLKNQLNELNEMVSKFPNQSVDQEMNEGSPFDHIRSILQSNIDAQHALASETSDEKHFAEDQQLIIDELTKEINELKEQDNHWKNQLKEITKLDNDDEETQFNRIRASFHFRLALSNKLSTTDDNEAILQRIEDYQLIVNTLNSPENDWTNETTDELITKLQAMKNAENISEDLQNRLDELLSHIKQIADQFAPNIDNNEESDITRIHQSLQSFANFHQKLSGKTEEEILQLLEKSEDKQDVEIQTTDSDELYLQIKELMGIEEDQHPDEMIKKMKELFETSQRKMDEDEQLRNVLNIQDENLLEVVMKLHENFYQLTEEHERLVEKENLIDQSIERLMDKIGLSSDSSSRARLDEISIVIDSFCGEYGQLMSTNIDRMNLMEIFKHIPSFLIENNRLKKLIHQIDFNEFSEDLDYISKLQTYLTKVDTLCQLISNENVHIDQALVIYRKKIEHDNDVIEKISDFKQQLLTRLSIDNEEQIFDRLDEIEQINTDLKEKLQNINDSTSALTSLNTTLSEQRNKILEYEDTIEKLRSQRERMLNKMKEMKTNNEALTNQLNQANQSIHRTELDSKNQIEELEQRLRSAHNQIQVTLDDCRTQEDLQETMKLEIESLKKEMENQRKLYENRCRQIINEKKQLDKTTKQFLEEKQLLEEENQQLQTILQTIKDTLENVDDIHSIVDTIIKFRQNYSTLHRHKEEIQNENEKLLLNIHEQENTIEEYIQTKNELEQRLIDNEQQLINFKKELKENSEQYQRLQNEFQLYKEEHSTKANSQIAVINIEQSPPPLQPHLLAVQQAAEANEWMAIDMKDEEIPLATTNKHPIIDTSTAILNILGELKSKLGITLTHRPRSSSIQNPNMPLIYQEVRGDLFSAPATTALAHCVSKDMNMGKGIATLFRDQFAQVDKLKKQNVQIGGCAYITPNDRYVFYLVTKEKYFHKPTMSSLESSVRTLRDLCLQNDIHHLAMPRIGCGLDKLNWNQVSKLIQDIFREDDMEITIYTLE